MRLSLLSRLATMVLLYSRLSAKLCRRRRYR